MTGWTQLGAAVDVGSNSVHLLIAEIDGEGVRTVVDESVLLGLGAIVDREGSVPDDAIASTVEALLGYVERSRAAGAREITLLATEPLRRASNRTEVQAAVLRATGRPLHVLRHTTEAELTLLGITLGRPVTAPIVALDIGGGSTELVLAAPGRDPVVGALPTGSSRLTAALVSHDPPTADEIAALRTAAAGLFAAMPEGRPERAIVAGGTGTNLTKLLGLPRLDPLDLAAITAALGILVSMPVAELLPRFLIGERRGGQLAAGAVLLEAALTRYRLTVAEVSDAGLREGAILAASICGDAWPERLAGLISGTARGAE